MCIFSILNWFYPYQNWGISAEDAISFNLINKGSDVLINEFPSHEDFIDTKEKIEKIKLEIEKATRQGDWQRVSELQYGELPILEKHLKTLDESKSKDNNLNEKKLKLYLLNMQWIKIRKQKLRRRRRTLLKLWKLKRLNTLRRYGWAA
mgnify:CR=1 FL=1